MTDNNDSLSRQEIVDDPEINGEIQRLHLQIDSCAQVSISQDALPSDPELARNGSVLIMLGKKKQFTIWGIVKTVGFIISTFVAIIRLPESIEKAHLYLADAHDYVCHALSVHVQPPPPITWLTAPDSHDYLIAKDSWLTNMQEYIETQERVIAATGASSTSSLSSSSSVYESPSLSATTVPPGIKIDLADNQGVILIPISGLATQIRIDIDLNA